MFYIYKCSECGFEYDEPEEFIDTHGFTSPPYEIWHVCPNCGEPVGDNDLQEITRHD